MAFFFARFRCFRLFWNQHLVLYAPHATAYPPPGPAHALARELRAHGGIGSLAWLGRGPAKRSRLEGFDGRNLDSGTTWALSLFQRFTDSLIRSEIPIPSPDLHCPT